MATAFWGLWHNATLPSSDTSINAQRIDRNWQRFVKQLEPELMQSGDTGYRVKTLQLTLQALSIYKGMADGDFGPYTAEAVRNLQKQLGVERNGIFDQATWYALAFWTPCIV